MLLEKAKAYHKLDSYFVDNLEKECDTVKKLLVIPQVIEQPVFRDKFEIELTPQQLKTLIKNSKQKVEELQKSEALTLELAQKVGLINLHSKINRTLALEEIVRMTKDGYQYETQSSRGEIITLRKREPKAAIDALKALKEEWAERIEPISSYTIIVKDLEPVQEESLAGDEDL